jgi:tetratricopeptide (TPR) repeat protein
MTRRRRKNAPVDPLMSRRAMEKTLSDIGRILQEKNFESIDQANQFLQEMLASGKPLEVGSSRKTALEQAQDLMYEAWDAVGKKRIELAKQALELSPDCADAYVLLAEEAAQDAAEARKLYEQGVTAGERALGPEVFEEDVGHFWGLIETRPYMRARLGLAQCLWFMGEKKEAIAHYTDMLRLNPNDNQGIRYLLLGCLLQEGEDAAVEKLLAEYEDDGTAAWLYSRALLVFRREGPSRSANACLKKALRQNRHVPLYFLGRKKLPKFMPEYVGWGDENEAIAYVAQFANAWLQTPGAVDWLSSARNRV